jgi:hypothetical protein
LTLPAKFGSHFMDAILREVLGRLCPPASAPSSIEPRFSFPDPSSPNAVVKMIRVGPESSRRAVLEFFRECLYLIECESRLTVRLLGISMSPIGFQLRTPRYSNGSLHDYLVARGMTMTPTQLSKCAFGVIAGINHLHRHGIHHRDIKAENVLLTDSLEPVLCDLGSSRTRASRDDLANSGGVGTPHTRAPETLSYSKLAGFASDIWGYGMVLYVLLTMKMPWKDHRPDAIKRKLERGVKPPFPESCRARHLKILALMERCTAIVPDNRPKSGEIIDGFLSGDYQFDGVDENGKEEFGRYMKEIMVVLHETRTSPGSSLFMTHMAGITTWRDALRIQQIADRDLTARFVTATLYRSGIVFDRDDCQALRWLNKWRGEDIRMMREEILRDESCYARGCAAQARGEFQTASELFMSGALQGCQLCLTQLGDMLLKLGKVQQGCGALTIARKLGNKKAAFLLAMQMIQQGDTANGLKELQFARSLGHLGAEFVLQTFSGVDGNGD